MVERTQTCRNKSAFITTFYIQNLKFTSFITTCLGKMKEILAFILPARGSLLLLFRDLLTLCVRTAHKAIEPIRELS